MSEEPPTLLSRGMRRPSSAQVKPPTTSTAIINVTSPEMRPIAERIATRTNSRR